MKNYSNPARVLARLTEKESLRVIGLMSGTSMDGLDICLAQVSLENENLGYEIENFTSISFPENLRDQIRVSLTGTTQDVCALNYDLGRWYADTVYNYLMENGIEFPDLVGSHGQTIHHVSGHSTLQIGEPSYLAQKLGVPVISDFRAADVAAGGTGAPLIPRIDEWLFRDSSRARIALNIGGVANVTLIPPAGEGTVIGFDTGPGMALLDETFRSARGGGYDPGGKMALTGVIDTVLVEEWINDDFITALPPKSTGRDQYGLEWLNSHRAELLSLEINDRLATLAAFTADSIYANCRSFLEQYSADYLIVGGGGVHHGLIMERLSESLAPSRVVTSEHFGLDPDAKEALGFAILAVANVRGVHGNLPTVTGADRPVILGKLSL